MITRAHLSKMNRKLDEVLERETKESLIEWYESKQTPENLAHSKWGKPIKGKWEACLLGSGQSPNPLNRNDFQTEEEAFQYILTMMCDDCKKEYQKEQDNPVYHGFYPCLAEWYIGEIDG